MLCAWLRASGSGNVFVKGTTFCACEVAQQVVLCCEVCWTLHHLELQVVVGRWTRWSFKEEIVCVLAEMRFVPGLGNIGPFVVLPLGRSWYGDLLAGADVAQQCIWETDVY